MVIDLFLVGFSFAAGAASFFSPCSVGLFPAYIGYFLSLESRGEPALNPGSDPWKRQEVSLRRVLDGIRLGLMASLGFFLLFLGVGGLVATVGGRFLGPSLKWISVGIGAAIVALGLIQLGGRDLRLALPFKGPSGKGPLALLAFGVGYGLASLGCTLPVFLSALFASLAAGGGLSTFLVLLSYAAGMGLVMVVVTTSLAVSEETARAFLRRAIPFVRTASSVLLVLAGLVVIYYYTVIWT